MNSKDFAECLKWYTRMCINTPCADCGVYKLLQKYKLEACNLDDIVLECPDEFADVVTSWVKEHPMTTNAMKFQEVFGSAPTLYNSATGTIIIEEPNPFWWNEEYKKPD